MADQFGRISGPLLANNLLRDGVDLSFETNLLYLDVNNAFLGVNTDTPTRTLTVNGTTSTVNLLVDTQADLANFTLSTNTIRDLLSTITISPSQATNPIVATTKFQAGSLQVSNQLIQNITANSDINLSPTGKTVFNSSRVNVNGTLHATGNITFDGDITFANANTDNVTFSSDINSDLIPNIDNTYNLGSLGQEWATLYSTSFKATNINTAGLTINSINLLQTPGKTLYVSVNGNDTYYGTHQHSTFKTIKYALSQATSGDTIVIFPGIYTEIFPLTVPQGVAIKGAGIRSVNIQPTVGTNDKDAFLLNGETTVEDLSISGFFYNNANNTGYAFRFASNFTVTTRSPYIRNITVITRGSVTSGSDPYGFDQNDAGKGALADGSVANSSSKEASMLFHSATFFTPNQETIIATNGVRIEWLNSFTYFADKGLYAHSGSTGFTGAGQTRLRIDNRTGTFAVGNTLTYYDTNGTTVLASGTIASVVGNYVNLTSKCVGFQTITDRAGKTVYPQGGAKLSTAQKKFGSASLALNGTTDYATVPTSPDFAFGTGAFTIEMWVYRVGNAGVNQILLDFRPSNPSVTPVLYLNTTYVPTFLVNGVNIITGSAAVPLNTWTHIAVSKSGTSTKMFVNGTQSGSTYTDNNNYIQNGLVIGANFIFGSLLNGYIDDLRIEKGVAKYTANFTAPTQALIADNNTVLLLAFDGTNNSTTFLDNGYTQQDIRTSAGGRASLINFADYSDFGAEVRSIGSANVYGTYGTYGDGDGVIIYLISQNYAYVGSGKLSTNDPNDRIAANEVVKLNRAKIYYTSVDNEGNFKVGDAFYVNQKTGDVLFNNQSLTINAPAGVVFTDGTHTTTILPESITTGNIRIHDNNIDSLTGDINVTAASGIINLQNNTYITGNLDVTGDITLGGNIQIGDQTSDTINFVGGISSNLIPSQTATYNLGQGGLTPLRWNNVYLSRAEVDGVVIDGNNIGTTVGNDNLTFSAAGSGKIYVPSNNVQLDQNLIVGQNLTVTTGTTYLKDVGVTGTITQTGDINQTGNFTTSGNTQVTGNITATGYLQLPQIDITGNTISTRASGTDLQLTANGSGNVVFEGIKVSDNNIQSTVTNSNITLTPQGTGSVVVNSNQSLIIPVGTTAQRPALGTETLGMIRYNTDLNRYEAWNGTYWVKLSGVQDLDGNTYITAESAPGANENVLSFYADGNLMVTIDSTKLFAERIQTNNLDISGNTISNLASNADINLTTSGTGGVRIGNLRIRNNTITNVVSGAITDFSETGTGYVKISGTNGVVIPSGVDNDRPGNAVAGMMRFNTQQSLVEVYNGVTWTSVAGTSSGVTFNEAQDIGIGIVLTLG